MLIDAQMSFSGHVPKVFMYDMFDLIKLLLSHFLSNMPHLETFLSGNRGGGQYLSTAPTAFHQNTS